MNDVNNFFETLAKVLIRCFFLSLALLIIWLGFMVFARDLAYCVHSRFIPITRQQFDCIQYGAIAVTKVCIFLYFLLPYIAIKLVLTKKQ